MFGKKEPEVLAVITEEECKLFEECTIREVAIQKMLDNLTDQMEESIKREQEVWEKVKEKYSLAGGLALNRETGEITRKR